MDFPAEFSAHGQRLRAYRDEDAPNWVAGLNDPQSRRFQQGAPGQLTVEHALNWIRAAPTRFAAGGDRVVYAVADPETDELLGGVLLAPARARASVEIGFWICPAARGRGVATATARALTDLCFAQDVQRVEMLIRWDNTPSLRMARAAGFRPEGELRSVVPGAHGARHDAIMWSRLPADRTGRQTPLLEDFPDGGITDGAITLRPICPEDGSTLLGTTDRTAEAAERYATLAQARWIMGQSAAVLVVDATTGEVVGELVFHRPAPGRGHAVLEGISGHGGALLARGSALMAAWAFATGAVSSPVLEILGQEAAPRWIGKESSMSLG